MGANFSRFLPFRREESNVLSVDYSNANNYKWPPLTGRYFGTYFIMGGERFDSQSPEAFLFGENSDLNFLGNRPVPFPYATPQLSEPTRTLRSLVNIRKDSIRLVREDTSGEGAGDAPITEKSENPQTKAIKENVDPENLSQHSSRTDEHSEHEEEGTEVPHHKYNIEFTFDSDVATKITVFYFVKEEMQGGSVVYTPTNEAYRSETYRFKAGANQVFSQSTFVIEPHQFTDEQWTFDVENAVIPIVIHCVVDEPEHKGHSHATLCMLEKAHNVYSIKPVKQKQCVDGLLYILQEFYGIENKETETRPGEDDEFAESTAECVICMSELRDTLILPCRHLCLCNTCADSLRYQASACPICRAPFRALLQIRAIRKKGTKPENQENTQNSDEDEMEVSQKGVPSGYEAISLIEALNGPSFLNRGTTVCQQQQRLGSQGSMRRSAKRKKTKRDSKGSRITLKDKSKDETTAEERAKDAEVKETLETEQKTADEKPAEEKSETDKPVEDAEESEKPADTDEKEKEAEAEKGSEAETEETRADNGVETVAADAVPANSVKPEVVKLSPRVKTATVRQTSNSSISSGEDMTSAKSETTTLPGTPDYVLDDNAEEITSSPTTQ